MPPTYQQVVLGKINQIKLESGGNKINSKQSDMKREKNEQNIKKVIKELKTLRSLGEPKETRKISSFQYNKRQNKQWHTTSQ